MENPLQQFEDARAELSSGFRHVHLHERNGAPSWSPTTATVVNNSLRYELVRLQKAYLVGLPDDIWEDEPTFFQLRTVKNMQRWWGYLLGSQAISMSEMCQELEQDCLLFLNNFVHHPFLEPLICEVEQENSVARWYWRYFFAVQMGYIARWREQSMRFINYEEDRMADTVTFFFADTGANCYYITLQWHQVPFFRDSFYFLSAAPTPTVSPATEQADPHITIEQGTTVVPLVLEPATGQVEPPATIEQGAAANHPFVALEVFANTAGDTPAASDLRLLEGPIVAPTMGAPPSPTTMSQQASSSQRATNALLAQVSSIDKTEASMEEYKSSSNAKRRRLTREPESCNEGCT
jgi:hypothetical protein